MTPMDDEFPVGEENPFADAAKKARLGAIKRDPIRRSELEAVRRAVRRQFVEEAQSGRRGSERLSFADFLVEAESVFEEQLGQGRNADQEPERTTRMARDLAMSVLRLIVEGPPGEAPLPPSGGHGLFAFPAPQWPAQGELDEARIRTGYFVIPHVVDRLWITEALGASIGLLLQPAESLRIARSAAIWATERLDPTPTDPNDETAPRTPPRPGRAAP